LRRTDLKENEETMNQEKEATKKEEVKKKEPASVPIHEGPGC
jgi:hypothetical protein